MFHPISYFDDACHHLLHGKNREYPGQLCINWYDWYSFVFEFSKQYMLQPRHSLLLALLAFLLLMTTVTLPFVCWIRILVVLGLLLRVRVFSSRLKRFLLAIWLLQYIWMLVFDKSRPYLGRRNAWDILLTHWDDRHVALVMTRAIFSASIDQIVLCRMDDFDAVWMFVIQTTILVANMTYVDWQLFWQAWTCRNKVNKQTVIQTILLCLSNLPVLAGSWFSSVL